MEEQPELMDGGRMLRNGAMIRLLYEKGRYIVFTPQSCTDRVQNNELPHEFVLLDDQTGKIKGVRFSDKDWSQADGDPVNLAPMTGEELRFHEWCHSMNVVSYRNVLGMGPFEYVIEAWMRDLLTVKIVTGEQVAHERLYAPVDLMIIIKNPLKRTWIPRTDKGDAFLNNLKRDVSLTFIGKIWDNYQDGRGFERVKLPNPEWWLTFCVERLWSNHSITLPEFDPRLLTHLRKPLVKRERTKPGSKRAMEIYRLRGEEAQAAKNGDPPTQPIEYPPLGGGV